MIIEILGIGDARSDELEAAVRGALAKGLRAADVTVRRFDDPARMIARGIRHVPGLVIDGTTVCRGRVPGAAEIREWLAAATKPAGGSGG
ncbi:MAG: thioredoxin family protein [Actinomycetes bacterium]